MLGNLISAGANLLGGILGNNAEEENAKRNIRMQKEFAQQGIRWKVEDAKAAGVHPLYALGANTHSFAPVSVGGSSLAQGLSAAGQDIGRAVHATSTEAERSTAFTKASQELQLQRMGLENELLASQIAKVRQAGSVPAMPSIGSRHLIDGQGDSAGGPLIMDQALKRVASAPENTSQEAGSVADVGHARTPTGWAPVMSKDVQERTEEDWLGSLYWSIRNRMVPALFDDGTGGYHPPAGVPLKKGHVWRFHPGYGEWRQVPKY